MMASVINYRSPLHAKPPSPSAPFSESIVRKVVVVLIDALRLDTSLETSVMPFLNELRLQGASAVMHSRPPSFSESGYTTILTGAWPDLNDGPVVNWDYAFIPQFTQDDIFSAVHRAGLRTAISASNWFGKMIPPTAVDASFYTSGGDAEADRDVMGVALPMLLGKYQLVLIHLDQVDYAGHHQGGPLSSSWAAAAKRTDDYLREITAALDLKQGVIIVLSDHGQVDRGGHGGPDPVTLLEPFVMTGAGVQPGHYADIQQVDVAPTIAAMLGANIPASSEGTVLTDMLSLSPGYEAGIFATQINQKANLLEVYAEAINKQPGIVLNPGNPQSYMNTLETISSGRLNSERFWRILISAIVVVLPIVFFIRRRGKRDWWLFIGALIYIVLFNFRYAILDGLTYSLSSISSAAGFITYMTSTAAFSLVISWLVIMARFKGFRSSPRRAAEMTLDFVLSTIYLLVVPILVSFAWNGLITTWTLPEFYTIFIALLSYVQIIFVVLAGFLLAGTSALIARLINASQ